MEFCLTATHWWVFSHLSLFTVVCFLLFSTLGTRSNYVTFDCCLLCLLEELCLELSRAIEAGDTQAASQHASALARQKVALTVQLSEKNYADGAIRWEINSVQGLFKVAMSDNNFRVHVAHDGMFLLQFICCSGGCFVLCVCHSQSLSLHDCGCTQATGEKICKLPNKLNGFRRFSLINSNRPRSSGVFRVRVPSSCAALGDRSVFMHRAKVTGLLWGAEGWWYSVPVPNLCPTSPNHTPAVPAGPGERPPRPTSPTRQQPHLPRL